MTITFLSIIVLWLVSIIGWVWNIFRIVAYFPLDFQTEGAQLIVRLIGVIVGPLGAILGYIPF